MTALWDQIERAARLRGDEMAISCTGERLSWREARNRAAAMASVLCEKGAVGGARVAFIAPNGLAYMLMPFALDCAGGSFVPINSRLALPEIVEQLEDTTPALMIAAPPFVEIAREAASQCDLPLLELDEFLSLASAESPFAPVLRDPDWPVAIYYTGGTTGRAKGVLLHGERLVMNALQWAHAVNARDDENLLIVAPMFHMVAALNSIIACVLACDLTILDRFTPDGTLQAIAEEGVTNMGVVPAMIDMMFAVEDFADYDLSSLRILTYGGSPISKPTLDTTVERLAHVRLYQIYGQTEGGPTISVLGPEWHSTAQGEDAKLRSAGKPLALINLKITRPDGSECERGETGEIAVKGPSVAIGYWNRPEETARAFREGWLHTGDAAYLDEDGFLFIVDRIKDMIVSGGENVYAAEVERVVIQHPAVQEVAVIGIPSDRWGEAVHAIIRLQDGANCDEAEIIAFCREQISAYKSPRSVDFRSEPFPLTGAGKVDKQALRAEFARDNTA